MSPTSHEPERVVLEPAEAGSSVALAGALDSEHIVSVPTGPSAPWYRRSSPWWMLTLMPARFAIIGANVTPQLELLNRLACATHRPELGLEHINWPSWRDPPYEASKVVALGLGNSTIGEICLADPGVQQWVTFILTLMTTLAGISVFLTAGWWGATSDRWGRVRLLCLVNFGLLLADAINIAVVYFKDWLPGQAYWWLIPAAIIPGVLGGEMGIQYTLAYLGDSTEQSTRASYYASYSGAIAVGLAIGPLVGGLLVEATGDLLSVCYLDILINTIYILLFIFVVPESLDPVVRALNVSKYEKAKAEWKEAHPPPKTLLEAAEAVPIHFASAVAELLKPLGVCLPQLVDPADPSKGRTWNFTLLTVSYGLLSIIGAIYAYFFQFMGSAFHWGSQEQGYWLSAFSGMKAIFLIVVFPIIMHFVKPKPIRLTGPENPLHGLEGDSGLPAAIKPLSHHIARFDLTVVRLSVAWEVLAYAALAVVGVHPVGFVVATLSATLAGGAGASISSLALELGSGAALESGKIFGALSVATSVCTQVIGPSIFGALYALTVYTHPRIILAAPLMLVGIALVGVMLIRLPADETTRDEEHA